ncbi:IPT/TIG domain-containing protein [Pseudopedobacter beijingensis]|uniref:IPT/TIG domain-containing protein n=1 Tax=Pseudopedobacter beijingensis TaxID=1207056 RepID=A0ABW4IEE6_9SPHI
MRNFKKIWIGICVLSTLIACKKEEGKKEDTTPPQITSVTDLQHRSTALATCDFGDWIIIKGNNLSTTNKIDFNTVLAADSLFYADDTTITVKVPSILPDVLNNPITVFTKYGSVKYGFQIKQPEPVVKNMAPAVGDPGDIVTITGLNFINVTTVKFGNEDAEIISSTPTEIKVKVPQSAYGHISVTTTSGTTQSQGVFGFKYALFTDALATGWSNASYSAPNAVVTAPSPVLRGTSSMKINYAGWGGFKLQKTAPYLDLNGFVSLKFSLYAESAAVGKKIRVFLNNSSTPGYKDITIAESGKWLTYEFPLSDFGSPTSLSFIEIKEYSGAATTVVYIDDLVLM